MQFVIRFCSVCQKDTMCQVYNNGNIRCLEHEPRKSLNKVSRFFVWGSGAAQSDLIKNAEPSEDAAKYAIQGGYLAFDNPDDWAVEVTCMETELDVVTRFDDNVYGYVLANGM